VRAKQFLKLLRAEDGGLESMAQRVWRQIDAAGRGKPWDSITVAAGTSQIDQLRLQLGEDVDVVAEPERRDTFPAIALACAYLKSEKGAKDGDAVGVLPVDSYVEDGFFRRVAEIEGELLETGADLILLGAKPTRPSSKYGYVVPRGGEGAHGGSEEVRRFKEKPDMDEARALIDEGALWNCGVFGLRLGYVLDILRDNHGVRDTGFQAVRDSFTALRKTSFDYEVVEKAKNIRVLRYEGDWKDLGTWETFTEEIDAAWGPTALEECENTHVVNELNIPVAALGMKNAVIVAGYDGILVAEKGETYKLKEAVAEIQGRTMYEERRWGSYKVLEYDRTGGVEALTKRLTLAAGKRTSYQYHRCRKEVWTIIGGEGVLYLDGEKRRVKAGDVVTIGVGARHGIAAEERLEIIEVQIGLPLIEEDIVHLEYDWE
jgi:mannose-1-phosphate guanylyltransferase